MPQQLRVQDLSLRGKRVLVRVDFNVPLAKDGSIADDTRIKETLLTLQYILDKGGSVILLSHLGRPKSKNDLHCSLGICAKRLSQLIGAPVFFATEALSKETEKMAHDLKSGQILLLENLRFYPAEENPDSDPNFAKSLAALGDCYVDDAFGSAHRKHSSITEIPKFFPHHAALGLLMQKEISCLEPLITNPARPFFAILGGAKISTKLGLLESLLSKVDAFFIGGAMAYTFLKAKSIPIGDSPWEENFLSKAETFLASAQHHKRPVYLPEDIVIADAFRNDATYKIISAKEGIPPGWQGLDIGPKTIETWTLALKEAKTCFWNGPLGVFEFPNFSRGTKEIAKAVASLPATTVVGGGDSVAAIHSLNIAKNFSHLSTGGGATLEYLEFKTLPGIEALSELK